MWQPKTLGIVIAEREFTFIPEKGKRKKARIRFGRPTRGPHPTKRGGYLCPIQITGLFSRPIFYSVGGVDSLQALIIALGQASYYLPSVAYSMGGKVEWLGSWEPIIFAEATMVDALH